jgi:uncharacterized protein (DUF2236 family)
MLEASPTGDRSAPSKAAPGPGSVTWKLHREVALLTGWGRAILLQIAHPLIAQGVAEHSAFASGSWGRARRLRQTLRSMLALTFGDEDEAAEAARRINRIHDRVHGAIDVRSGAFAPGTAYSAHDPDLLAWVHATLLDSFLLAYELFVAPLTDDERDRYCAEATRIEPLLGIPPGRLPSSQAALAGYVRTKLESGEIAVGAVARRLARQVLDPPLPSFARPVFALARLPAIGLLPPAIREAYGFDWTPRQERALRRIAAASRRILPLLPATIRYWPAARAATRGAGHSR